MTYRPRFPLPNRADRTWFPALVAATLLGLLVLQWALPRQFDLPEPAILRPFQLPPVVAPPPAPGPAGRSLFDPSRVGLATAVGTQAAAPPPPVGGATAAGVAVRRGQPTVFLQRPDGQVVAMVPGGVLAGWRLVGVDARGLRFRRGGEAVTLPFGGAAPVAPGPAR